jgi:hypothetical protein
VACGSRTQLETSSPVNDVTFDAGCPGDPSLWLLFDLAGDTDTEPGGIYAMRADGTGGHALTLPHAPAFFPSVSPDGSKLLYAGALDVDAGLDGGVDSALYAYDFASHTTSLVVTTSGLTYSALSPDGQTVSYVSGYSLEAIDANGANNRTLLMGPNCGGTGYGHPVFADSQTVVYGTGGVIGAIGINGSNNETLLTAIPGGFEYPNPAFSPDHQQIAVGLICDQQSPEALRIYEYASLPGATCESGQVLADVSPGSAPNAANDPSWGSNGLIAYGSGKDVYVIDAIGGTPTNLSAALTGDAGVVVAADPVWAPSCAPLP